jgi:hypothetical protein
MNKDIKAIVEQYSALHLKVNKGERHRIMRSGIGRGSLWITPRTNWYSVTLGGKEVEALMYNFLHTHFGAEDGEDYKGRWKWWNITDLGDVAKIIRHFGVDENRPMDIGSQDVVTKGSESLREMGMKKLTRICFNTRNWQRPSGDAVKLEGPNSYVSQHGFGHEEWLFRSDWHVDGWRYGFLQGVNKSRKKLLKQNEPFDLTLFTIQPDTRRRYVATITAVECLGNQQADEAIKIFKEKGWFDTMVEDIKVVGGDAKALGNSPEAGDILNIRFRLENIGWFKADEYAHQHDPVTHCNRYRLYDVSQIEQKGGSSTMRIRKGSDSLPKVGPVSRRGTTPITYTPEHALMQKKLLIELKKQFPAADIVREMDNIDIRVRTKTELLLFEIKSDMEPRIVIRQALGQILEYAFYYQRKEQLPMRLIIVGRRQLSSVEEEYLELLRQKFFLPLEYRFIDL